MAGLDVYRRLGEYAERLETPSSWLDQPHLDWVRAQNFPLEELESLFNADSLSEDGVEYRPGVFGLASVAAEQVARETKSTKARRVGLLLAAREVIYAREAHALGAAATASEETTNLDR